MDYEKLYKEALKRAKGTILYYKEHNRGDEAAIEDLEEIFPELKESWEEKIRKEILEYFQQFENEELRGVDISDWIIWLEKQGNIDKASYEIAEKEKYDFVNGQFIQCRKSFDEFKEYNSYWFEYIGNDTYVGRSDNILNKKFHITPRQLYRLFTQQHYYSKENNEFEKQGESKFEQCIQEGDKIVTNEDGTHFNVSQLERVSQKSTETKETAKEFLKSAKIMDGNDELADEYRLEKQNKENMTEALRMEYEKGKADALQERRKEWTAEDLLNRNEIADILQEYNRDDLIAWLEKQGEQKPTDKVEPKFKVGDWIVQKYLGKYLGTYKIIEVCESWYEVISYNNGIQYSIGFNKEDDYHLWTIQDAKDGDVIQLGKITAIFKEFIGNGYCKCYCSIYEGEFEISSKVNSYECYNATPATKEKCELLFQTMHEAGYKWDADKKKLKKIHVIDEGIRNWVNDNVPELAESEDERIRKALITFFRSFPYDSIENAGTNAKEVLAWLEKQEKSKFEQCIQEGDKIVTNEDGTHFNVSQLERVAKKATETEETAKEFLKSAEIMDENGKLADEYRLEKQGEKPQDANYPKFNFDDVLALQCCMETVKKVQEDKELYEKLNNLHGRVYDAYLLERQGEQKSAWSEEDETALQDALWCIEQARKQAKDENDMGTCWFAERWLKLLKERLKGE